MKDQNSLKKRNFTYNSHANLKFGNIGFFFSKYTRFEYNYFFFFKKLLKIFNKTKYSAYSKFFYWFFLKANFPVSKKSKNSRMGKGVGLFLRWAIRLNPNIYFLEILSFFNKYFFYYFNKNKILIFNLKICFKNKM